MVNLFTPYSNTLAFTVGNEIINSLQRWRAAPCVKAYARDIRRFMSSCHLSDHSRIIPLLYAAADNAIPHFSAEENDRLKLDYLACSANRGQSGEEGEAVGGGEEERGIDLFGVNLFRFCSDQCTFHSCESAKVVAAFASSPLPLLLTEYGCSRFAFHLNHTERLGVNPFDETRLLYSPAMSGVFSGGCAYTYGVRGGEDWAFFEGGGRAARGKPGGTKRCGWPNDSCRIDQYEQRLAEVAEREAERKRATAAQDADGDNAGDGGMEGGEAVPNACPTMLGFDLTIADSRQGAEGYEAVPCQAGVGRQATAQEREVEEEQERAEREEEAQQQNRTAASKAAVEEPPADDQPAVSDAAPTPPAPAEPVAEPTPADERRSRASTSEKHGEEGRTQQHEGDRGGRQEDGGKESSSGDDGSGAPSTSDGSRLWQSLAPSLLLVMLAVGVQYFTAG